MSDMNIKLHIEFEGNCEEFVEISPQSSILDLKKEVVNIYGGNPEDVKLKRKGEDEEFKDFPEDDELKIGEGLKDNDVIAVEFPVAGVSRRPEAQICTIWNATDDDLIAEVFYETKEVHVKRGFNTAVDSGFNVTEMAGNLGFELRKGDQTYTFNDKQCVQDISAHKEGIVTLRADLNADLVVIKLTKKECSWLQTYGYFTYFTSRPAIKNVAMKPNQQIIISSHQNKYVVEGVKKSFWGNHKNWQPKEGLTKNPHRNLAKGEGCKECEENQGAHPIHKCKICGAEEKEMEEKTTGCF